MDKCIFCEIVAGNIPSYKIYEDEKYLAFLDVFPTTEGHTLVIPKKHVDWVWDHDNLGEYFEVVGRIARHHRELVGEGGRENIFGWNVLHAHIHIKPREVDNMKAEKLSHEELVKIQAKFTMI
ncbi:MAG: HIT-family protein [Microgenomates group bacterium GW2011_GWC2_45_8]|nr:MAG: HIT-family protein [Microgenomates group bacterium GW2011_GWC2_45_8]